MEAGAPTVCPFCNAPVPADAFFCSNCGKELRERPIAIPLASEIGIYLLSALLPPLGLWPGIKYVRRSDPKAKRVGTVAIVLTVISTVASVWLSYSFLKVYLNTIQSAVNGGGLY